MSEVKVNKLSPRSGTTVTLGDSGDTFTVPSGVTFDASSGSLSGTLSTAAQPNITSVGTLTSFASTGIDDNATSTAVTIDSAEKVGINVTNPGSFYSDSNTLVVEDGLSIYDTSNSRIDFAKGTNGSDRYMGSIVYNHGSNFLRFNTNVNERMRIDSSGNVGIGTSSPSAKLHVADNIKGDGNFSLGTLPSGASSSSYRQAQIANSFIADSGGTNSSFQLLQNAYVGSGNNNYATVGSGASHANRLMMTSGVMSFSRAYPVTADSQITFSESMRIASNGNVGIGTSSPSSLLHIYSSSPQMIIQDGGTHGTNSTPGLVFKDSSSSQGEIGFENSGEMFIRQLKNADMTFRTNNSERMRIDSSGKVGINTTSPTGKFEVHSGGGGSNYSGSSAIKSGVTWGSESSSHTISIFDYNENDNSSGMLLVHAKADNNKCGTLMLLFTKKGGSGVDITTVSTKSDGMSTFSASTSGNNINISTDSDCAICWQSYYAV